MIGDLVSSLEAELEPLRLAAYHAYWNLYTAGEERWRDEAARLDTEIRTVLSRREPYEQLRDAVEGGIDDPVLARQAVLLLNEQRPNQLPPELIARIVELEVTLEERFNGFRAELDGVRVGDNHIREILERSDDVELRRRAWEAAKQIGLDVRDALLRIVRLRNDAARSLGFETYYEMMLECGELESSALFELLGRVESGTRPLFEAYKRRLDETLAGRFGVAPGELRPWHYSDPFFQEAPAVEVDLDPWFETPALEAIGERFFAAIGFDVRDVLRRSDLYEREGKSQHAFCFCLDRRDDIRMLTNLRSNEQWMATLLHELGHAVYDQHIDRSLPFSLRTVAHTLTTEASAMLFGRLSRNPEWLVEYAGMPEQEARAAATPLERARTATLLVGARWMLVMTHFERALYEDPEQDLNGLWWDLVERFQLIRRPPGRDAPDWAAKIHLSVSPAYYQNYLLGELAASQLQACILEEVLGAGDDRDRRYVTSPAVGAYLRDRLYRPGASLHWQATLERATGRPLAPEPFIAELRAGCSRE